MILNKLLRRISMVILFLSAMYATVISITNMTFTDLHTWMENDARISSVEFMQINDRPVALVEKTFNNLAEDNSEGIEEVVHLDQYPSNTVLATGYTAGIESTGKTPDHPEYGITFSGVEVKRDVYSTIAADLDIYPLGTILYIPDYGYGVVADKGSAIKGNKVDLYYDTVEEVYTQWGKREVKVYVIELGDGQLTEDQLVKLNANKVVQVFREKTEANGK